MRLEVPVKGFDILVTRHTAEFERVGVNSCEVACRLMPKVMEGEVLEASFLRHPPEPH